MGVRIAIAVFLISAATAWAQPGCVWLRIVDADDAMPIARARVSAQGMTPYDGTTNGDGRLRICGTEGGAPVRIVAVGFESVEMRLPDMVAKPDSDVVVVMYRKSTRTPDVTVTADREQRMAMRLDDVTNAAIYAGKKTERIELHAITANTATNNPRQVYASIPGLNIWESDGAGLQLGIGGRGLSPNRTSNFTTRQNGYDISADPLGYPESYYTPPLEAVERIELVRGAGSLRYGTQFGGMLNFVMREGDRSKHLASRTRLSGGSFGFASLYTEVGGTVEGVNYIAIYRGARGDGWRPNSGFGMHTAYAAVRIPLGAMCKLQAEYTYTSYLAQQPGGLTDRQFAVDPYQSSRSRNWFGVDWNLASLRFDGVLSETTTIQSILFATLASRRAVGNLERINVIDMQGERTLIDGRFENIGNETTLMHDVELFDTTSTVLAGWRLFRGTTTQRQGNASAGSDADFRYLRPNNLEGSDFRFPNDNAALFAEAVLRLGSGWAVVPGIRFEHITTRSNGYFKQRLTDFAGNVIVDTNITESQTRSRSFVIVGLGITRQLTRDVELYGNISQNYRSITFSDLRIDNPNLIVDTAITDERGYNADIGIRGCVGSALQIDASVFYLRYDRRIGQILRADQAPLFLPYRYRTNIADAYTAGIEAVATLGVSSLLGLGADAPDVRWMVNVSVLRGEYINTDEPSVRGRQVELVPPYTLRTGLRASWGNWNASILAAVTGRHYTDATNAELSATAVNGSIPQYTVVDASVRYRFGSIAAELSVNNALDALYFTRRAEAYPGPGIIPADIRSVTLTLEATL